MSFTFFNGTFVPSGKPLFSSENPCFKWGDGLFETILVQNTGIRLAAYHFERLFSGLQLLRIDHANIPASRLEQYILDLCKKNDCQDLARVRLSVYRDDQQKAVVVIDAWPLDLSFSEWNDTGWKIGIYPFARKSMDALANLKTANFLPYVMAGMYAKEKNLDDALILNAAGNLCDSSKANIFLIKDNEIFTPALHQGCIGGVMRRYLIERLKKKNIPVHQSTITEEELLDADEVFLSNVIIGIRSVGSFKDKVYHSETCKEIYFEILRERSEE